MSKKIATVAIAALMAGTAVVPAAYADRDRNYRGDHHSYNDHHRGRGHWKNGKWIALGVAAAAAAAIADSRDCYYRHGRRYCRD